MVAGNPVNVVEPLERRVVHSQERRAKEAARADAATRKLAEAPALQAERAGVGKGPSRRALETLARHSSTYNDGACPLLPWEGMLRGLLLCARPGSGLRANHAPTTAESASSWKLVPRSTLGVSRTCSTWW